MINLEVARRQAGLSQRKLSELSKVGQNYISFAENRGYIPAEGTQKRLADFLKWTKDPRELFQEFKEKED